MTEVPFDGEELCKLFLLLGCVWSSCMASSSNQGFLNNVMDTGGSHPIGIERLLQLWLGI